MELRFVRNAENVALHFRKNATLQQAKSITYLTSTPANCRRSVKSIRERGQLVRIVTWSASYDADDTFILDGVNRLDARELVGLPTVTSSGQFHCELKTHHIVAQDPYALVEALNLHRRHLNAEQRRELAARLDFGNDGVMWAIVLPAQRGVTPERVQQIEMTVGVDAVA